VLLVWKVPHRTSEKETEMKKSLMATLASLLIVLVVAVTPAPANAITDHFTDRKNDVRTPNDIRKVGVKVTASLDVFVTIKRFSQANGQVAIWVNTISDDVPQLMFYASIKPSLGDAVMFLTGTTEDGWSWNADTDPLLPDGCEFTYNRTGTNTVHLHLNPACAPDTSLDDIGDGVRVTVSTNHIVGGYYRSYDYAPARHMLYPAV
jgi:hypothetical protein